jgi:hypothetical protein
MTCPARRCSERRCVGVSNAADCDAVVESKAPSLRHPLTPNRIETGAGSKVASALHPTATRAGELNSNCSVCYTI